MGHGTMGHGTMGHGAMGHGAMGHGTMGHGAMGHGAMGHGAMGHGTMGHGAMGHGAMGHGAMGHGAMGHGTMGHGAMGHGTMGHGAMGHGTMGHDAMGHGTMGHGAMGHGAMGHGAMGHGAMGHGTMGHGAMLYILTSTSGTPPSAHSAHSLATAARHTQAQGGRGMAVGKGAEGHGASLQQPLLDAAAGVMGGVGRQGAGGGLGGGRGGGGGFGGGGRGGGVGSSAASDGARTPRFRWQKLRVKGRQRIVLAVVSFISLLTAVFALLIWYGFGDNPIDPTLMAQMHADFFAVATLLSGGGLAFYGLLLFSKMSVLRAGPSAADLSKIAWLAGMCLLCFSLRAFIVLAKYIPSAHIKF
ncbi:unnamed protein product [Closterium sp. NIES-65]|nr:unnamed protein product [Closterium sp. NIES-65]